MDVGKGGCTVRNVAAQDFIEAYAAHLKRVGAVELPKWADYVKTGTFKELAPYDPDWFFVRMAAIARRIYLQNGIGVGALKKMYGGSVNRGFAPSRFQTASGKIIRTALQELEKMGIIEKDESGGRRLTSKGQGEMDTQVAKIMSASS
uniref:40S ribosomal protein S19 n=1 Tax=Compsopogon caeruleus TaxID=31354 RepID=A0A7S1THF1_9RHOD|mmetsp:Transcript_7767/g.15670  ORF Transcript_7767/g.15670 Transcript_7767/m.15670 type:complete len:148 (+) Transcript_7767:165-608(+)